MKKPKTFDRVSIGFGDLGIGIDIESLHRFEGLNKPRDRHFLRRIFTSRELAYCFSKSRPAPHLATRFACKEAVIKALGSLGRKVPNHNELEITRNKNGAPSVRFHNIKGRVGVRVSLAHSSDSAVALAVVIENGE